MKRQIVNEKIIMECLHHISSSNTDYQEVTPDTKMWISLEHEDTQTSDEELLDSQTETGMHIITMWNI